ncbi:MAG: twitching motility protein PilT [Lachnospiraceae bacterium]|nr:twitching motility protein PilT [Lachnospiraceae bacterium]
MVQIISGTNGKGKSSYLLDSANTAIKEAHGDIVFIDKSSSKMHDLSNRIRLIDMSAYPIGNYDNFIGYIYGVISQNYDLEKIYIDNFMKVSCTNKDNMAHALEDIQKVSDMRSIDFYLGISMDADDLPKVAKSMDIVAL